MGVLKAITSIMHRQATYSTPTVTLTDFNICSLLASSKSTTAPTPKILHLCILGPKAAGKTTLWLRLQNKPFLDTSATPRPHDMNVTLDNKIHIKRALDIPGGDNAVRAHYANLLKDATLVFFLFDIRDILQANAEKISAIRMRLCALQRKESSNQDTPRKTYYIATWAQAKDDTNENYEKIVNTLCIDDPLRDLSDEMAKNLYIGNLIDNNFFQSLKNIIMTA